MQGGFEAHGVTEQPLSLLLRFLGVEHCRVYQRAGIEIALVDALGAKAALVLFDHHHSIALGGDQRGFKAHRETRTVAGFEYRDIDEDEADAGLR
jgi:hypothetical protein